MSITPGAAGVAASFPDGCASVAGSVTAPTYKFSDTTTGFYRPAVNEWALTSNGVQTWLVSATGAHTIGAATGSPIHTINGVTVNLTPPTGTAAARLAVFNNVGGATLGVESSVGGSIITGSAAYSLALKSDSGMSFAASGAGTLHGSVSTAGAWTLGAINSAAGHTFNSGSVTSVLPTTGVDYLHSSGTVPTVKIGHAGQTSTVALTSSDTSSGYLIGAISSDTGTAAAIKIDGRLRAGGSVVTRPIMEVTNADVVLGSVSATGAWSFPSQPVYQARGRSSGPYSLGAGASIRFQSAIGFSRGTGTSTIDQYTIPATGIYLLSVSVHLSTATTAAGFIDVKVNGSAVSRIDQFGSGVTIIKGTIPINVNAGDVITLVNSAATGGFVSDAAADAFISFMKIA